MNPYDIMSITDTAAATHPWATQSRAYTYDNVDRLLTASSTTPGNNSYGYDNVDNATSVTNPSGTVTPVPTYNANNQLATWAANTYAYDSNGNTVSGDGTKTYKWDAENRLVEIDYVGGTDKTTFAYDGINHRTVQADTIGGVTTTTRYLWCGDRICQKRDGSDTVLKRYLYEGEYNVSTLQKLIYMPDQLDSVRDVLDGSTGTRVASYDYTPYGSVARSSVTNGTDYQYANLFSHPQSGLNLATYRADDGNTGRWINRDPIRESGGVNLYTYVTANPITGLDATGLCDEEKQKFCDKLLADIFRKGANIILMISKYSPVKDGMGGWPTVGGKLTKPGGHYQKITEAQDGLRADIDTYDRVCRDGGGGGGMSGIPTDILDAATKSLPKPIISNMPEFIPIPPIGSIGPVIITIMRLF